MSRILIGSSNICRFYKPEAFKDYKRYTTVRCTRFEPFKARMACIEAKEKEIVISVIENFVCDAVGSDPENEDILNNSIEKILKDFVEVIRESADKLPETKFVLACPIQRPRDKWYVENFDEMKQFYIESINKLKKSNVTTVDAILLSSQKFEQDLVHLTEDSGWNFDDGILEVAEAFFKAELVDLEKEEKADELMQEEVVPIPSGSSSLQSSTGAGLPKNADNSSSQDNRSIEIKVQQLNTAIIKRKESDNLVFARMREELDTISNAKKEDRLIRTGLTSKIPPPNSHEEKKKWLSDIVTGLLNKLDPELAKNVIFINQGKRVGIEIPMVEVRMTSKEFAKKARMTFVSKIKQGEDFGRTHMANSVCLATRVRVDILKAIARQFGNQNGETMYVSAFTSRPVLHIKKVGEDVQQRPFIMTFADAIQRYGTRIEQDNLAEAYKRVGRAFYGQLEQHFVVLKDDRRTMQNYSAPAGLAKKRPNEDQDHHSDGNNKRGRGRGARGGRGVWKSRQTRQ